MEDELSDVIAPEELKKFEDLYHEHLYKADISPNIQFDYASCLVRSKYPADIKKGILLLEELYKTHEEGRRDYLYYLALGNGRIKEYTKALKYIRGFLSIEPGNSQIIHLQSVIQKRMDKEGRVGMAIAGGIVFAVGAVIMAGMKLSKS